MAVVVASDLSRRSKPALARGARLSKDLALPLHVVHVVDPDMPPAAHQALVLGAGTMLRQTCGDSGAEAIVEIIRGDARTSISRYALDVGAGLIVLGTHDSSKDGFFHFNETTAARVARSCPTPVLVVKGEPSGPYGKAVVGVDFSIFSLAAIRQARRLAPQAQLHLVHAYQVSFRSRLGKDNYLAEVREGARLEFDRFLNEDMPLLVKRAALPNAEPPMIQHEVVEGTPYLALKEAVEKLGAELLAIGTHGSGAVMQTIWGSVATALLEDPPCDLLVVHEA